MVSGPAWLRLRFDFTADEPLLIPGFSGSAWRGLLGHALKRSACVTGPRIVRAVCWPPAAPTRCCSSRPPEPPRMPGTRAATSISHHPCARHRSHLERRSPPRPAPARHLSTGDSFQAGHRADRPGLRTGAPSDPCLDHRRRAWHRRDHGRLQARRGRHGDRTRKPDLADDLPPGAPCSRCNWSARNRRPCRATPWRSR